MIDDEIHNSFMDITNDEYVIESVNIDNIIDELNLNEDNAAITKSIILSLENEMAKGIRQGKIVSLPLVGNIQRNLLKDKLQEHNKELRLARTQMSKEEYKEYYRDLRKSIKNEIAIDYANRRIIYDARNKRKDYYDKVAINYGITYANLHIKALMWFKDVPFDKAIQEQYDKIAGRYEE